MNPTLNRSSIVNGSICAALTLIGIQSSQAQGTILFDTHVEGFVDAKFYDPLGLDPLSGERFLAQLYVGAPNSKPDKPIGTPIPFGSGTEGGYLHGGEVSVPDASPYSYVTAEIRYWDKESSSYESAINSGKAYGASGSFGVQLTGPDESGNPDWAAGKLRELMSWPVIFPDVAAQPIKMDVKVTTNSVTLMWTPERCPLFSILVPEEADTPTGPWRDIEEGGGPWINEDDFRFNPPNPLVLPVSATGKFYRLRVTTNIKPVSPPIPVGND